MLLVAQGTYCNCAEHPEIIIASRSIFYVYRLYAYLFYSIFNGTVVVIKLYTITYFHVSRVYGYISWYIQRHCANDIIVLEPAKHKNMGLYTASICIGFVLHCNYLTHLCGVVRRQYLLWHVLRRSCVSMAWYSVTTSVVWNRYGHPYRSVKKQRIWTIITTLQTVGNTVTCW